MSLLNEIFEQPLIIRNLLRSKKALIEQVAKKIQDSEVRYVYLAARGSSDNAGKYAQYLFGAVNQLPFALAAPSLFSIYHLPPSLKNSLVIGISQSGKSPDIVSVIEEGKRQGSPTLVITNNPHSPMAEIADHVIDIQVGEEKAVAATKTYTGTLVALAMLSASIANNDSMYEYLDKIPEWTNNLIACTDEINDLAHTYLLTDRCIVLGRGYNYSTVYEWALKLKELSNVLAEPYSSADFLHGPVAMIKEFTPIYSVTSKGQSGKSLVDLLNFLRIQHKVNLFSISNMEEVLSTSQMKIRTPSDIPEWLSPIVNIIPAQLFTYFLTCHKGLDPDKPIGLQKITETN